LDIDAIDEVIAIMPPKESVMKRIMEGGMTLEDYKNCDKYEFVEGGFPGITLKSRGLTLLADNSSIFDIENNSLFIQVNVFYSFFVT
jgi:hypothetical protein